MRAVNGQAIAPGRELVLYWMIAARRVHSNFALQRAAAWARALGKPLVVLEALRVGYPWASDRLHRFVIDGMNDNAHALARSTIVYHPYVEPSADQGKGLLAALARRACVVVTDDFPCFFLPHMVAAAAAHLDVRLEAVDGNGLLPLAATDRDFSAAAHFRRHVQKTLPLHVADEPERTPSSRGIPAYAMPASIARRWPRASDALLAGDPAALARLPIDHEVPVAPVRGGHDAAVATLRHFVKDGLESYLERRGDPSADATSRLSPYLHFGHLSVHEVFAAVARRERWSVRRLATRATGKRTGWWGMSPGAEAFLEQLVVWRELGYNHCAKRPDDYDRYGSLPGWARRTLAEHARDRREHLYTFRQLEEARTQDPLWNAAQRQLRREGWFHNTMRMLWGKKILEWSRTPQTALATMIAIMNRWSLDGRDPSSYTGYFWTLGLFDRPWPERDVFGKVRTMSSERLRHKVDVGPYLARYGEERR